MVSYTEIHNWKHCRDQWIIWIHLYHSFCIYGLGNIEEEGIKILQECVLILIPDVECEAASDCPQQLTMIYLVLQQERDFASDRQFL